MTKEGTSNSKVVGANWNKLKTKVAANPSSKKKAAETVEAGESIDPSAKLSAKIKATYVGLDCEMVGIGPSGTQSALARCCLVDFDGEVIYDEFVRPPGFVTDFRTKWSGVRKKDLRQGAAISLQECQTAVANILKDKVLVGHALKNDLDVLMLSHPRTMIRDTATYRPYMRIHGKHGKVRPRALKDLTKEHLKLEIQAGEHDPGVDARCAVMLYRKAREAWEQHLKDIRSAAKNKALQAALSEKQASGKSTANSEGNQGDASSSVGAVAEGAHSKASTAGKQRADSITAELRREVYGTSTSTTAEYEGSDNGSSGGSEGSDEESSTGTHKKPAGASSDLVVLHKVEQKPKSKGKSMLSKADAVLSHVDIEVQVMDGTEDTAHINVKDKGKKRKVSKSGMISSHSSKHHSNEANKLVATKKARLGLDDSAGSAGGVGMFASSVATTPTSGAKKGESKSIFSTSSSTMSSGGSGKVRSIADVDRDMQRKHKQQKAATRGKK